MRNHYDKTNTIDVTQNYVHLSERSLQRVSFLAGDLEAGNIES